ncbi:sensor histidine kinase [Bacteroidota bacterium]
MINFKSNKFIYPIAFWAVLCLIFFLTVLNFEGFNYAIKILISIIFPVIIPVSIISVGFDKLFLKKKYFWFTILLVTVVGICGYCNTWWYKYLLGSQAYSGTYSIIIFISVAFIGIKSIRINFQQKQKFAQLESKQLHMELQLLKSQINPHFLFNSLNNLYGTSLNQPDLTPDLILKLSGLMRYTLESANEKFILLSKEIEYLESYIEFEKMRLSIPNDIRIDVLGDIQNMLITPMLLIPFIENSFKHGINSSVTNFRLHITIQVINNSFIFNIENSIPEISSRKDNNQKLGYGIQNTRRRLELIYANTHNLEINKTEKSFGITLEIILS